ncbi:sigma-70 family RNA polymerase sigma factor [Roseisolibacter sp. H3M3-2]|uniref:sigma-70 family RNA polymerase sigma factor n=1 Tax=Roseisolibacter sp. H3M3-2 TaxID=3031323 RepID=UPI0023DA130E|nr:sigma-70 family RNA polymerase sigma factor [Roseisolibacter sp. H3M3-2]MDF1504388.1 sigma-70 family RNA polymerase sigma factor [Roseisolibacter sp. H3M3-2]
MTTAAVRTAAFTAGLEQHRPALTGHCYRMLGSVVEAEDAVQEAMLRAWKALDRFQEQSSLKTWLYRIATNVCLDALAASGRRRLRPLETTEAPETVREGMALPQRPREEWVEPIPDAMALPAPEEAGPEERAILKESIRLAFVAALQYLPPRQRAALLLTQVLNFSAAEAAETLEMTVPSLNSALQRARATLAARNPAVVPRELSAEQEALVARYVAAFERYDVPALTALMHEEATLSMPPFDLWLRGHADIERWMLTYGIGCDGSKLVPVAACGGTPAFAHYRDGGATPWAIVLLEVEGGRITSQTSYLDVETLFPRFGMPMRLDR